MEDCSESEEEVIGEKTMLRSGSEDASETSEVRITGEPEERDREEVVDTGVEASAEDAAEEDEAERRRVTAAELGCEAGGAQRRSIEEAGGRAGAGSVTGVRSRRSATDRGVGARRTATGKATDVATSPDMAGMLRGGSSADRSATESVANSAGGEATSGASGPRESAGAGAGSGADPGAKSRGTGSCGARVPRAPSEATSGIGEEGLTKSAVSRVIEGREEPAPAPEKR